jgi:hypothetical protein
MLELSSILLNLHLSNITSTDAHSEGSPVRISHEVRTSQDIGGTIHIEPNDRPIAGQKTRIWIALTKRGGEVIPYAKCNCQMEVRSLTDLRYPTPQKLLIDFWDYRVSKLHFRKLDDMNSISKVHRRMMAVLHHLN